MALDVAAFGGFMHIIQKPAGKLLVSIIGKLLRLIPLLLLILFLSILCVTAIRCAETAF
jgi:hypothetical protein